LTIHLCPEGQSLSSKKLITKKHNTQKWIELPGPNRLISQFAKEASIKYKKDNSLFLRSNTYKVVEIGKIQVSKKKYIENGFKEINPVRFVTLLEQKYNPYKIKTSTDKYGDTTQKKYLKSISNIHANQVLESDQFKKNLPIISRILTVQLPIIYNNKLTFPNKGYDPRFNSWLSENAPIISNTNMSLKEAKSVIKEIYQEFCFKTDKDAANAIAALLTPYLKGIFSNFNTRTPVFMYMANRERAGKDYCAGITGIVYEGVAIEESPISDGSVYNNTNNELRKKITSLMINGRKRFHSSNNKGRISSSVLESVTTAETYSDRILGKNETVTFDNEIDFSLSGNIGTTLTPDLANRSIFINLFLDIEDANKRKFSKPNLHNWVKDNRDLILSALYSLVRNWISKGKPEL